MGSLHQEIKGSNNIQVGTSYGDIITTQKVVRKVEVIYDKDIHISDAQAKMLRDKIGEVSKNLAAGKTNGAPFKDVYNKLYSRYKISSYKLLPKERFDDAMLWLQKQVAIARPKLKKADNPEWRKQVYTAIHARINQRGISKEQFYDTYVPSVLGEHVASITNLSDAKLEKLYRAVLSAK